MDVYVVIHGCDMTPPDVQAEWKVGRKEGRKEGRKKEGRKEEGRKETCRRDCLVWGAGCYGRLLSGTLFVCTCPHVMLLLRGTVPTYVLRSSGYIRKNSAQHRVAVARHSSRNIYACTFSFG